MLNWRSIVVLTCLLLSASPTLATTIYQVSAQANSANLHAGQVEQLSATANANANGSGYYALNFIISFAGVQVSSKSFTALKLSANQPVTEIFNYTIPSNAFGGLYTATVTLKSGTGAIVSSGQTTFNVVAANAIIGACGEMNHMTTNTEPTWGLCSGGTASAVSGHGPWSWSCAGANGGGAASCKAYAVDAPPPQAVDAGFTTAALIDDFTIITIAPDGGSGIYNWYPFDGLTQYSRGDHSLTVSTDISGFGAGLNSFPTNSSTAALSSPGAIATNLGGGVIYRYGYFEASFSFDPLGYDYTGAVNAGYSNGGDWPSFWLAHALNGPMNGNGDFDEIDIFEAIPADRFTGGTPTDHSTATNTSTLLEWEPGYTMIGQNHFTVTPSVDFTEANTWGCLWTPTSISIYLNNVLQSTVAIGPSTPYPSAAIDFNSILLGTGYNWPITYNFVHVWQ